MFLKVFIIGTVLGTVVSKFNDSPNAILEFTRETLNNNRNCEDTKQWTLVERVDNREYVKFYKSSKTSLVIPENIELYVQVKSARNARLVVSYEDEENKINYVYNGSRQESEIDWCKLVFPVGHSGFTYINLIGYIEDSENVLTDSLYYKPEIYKINHANGDEAIILHIQEHEIDATEIEETEHIDNEIINVLINDDEESDNGNIREDTVIDIDQQDNGDVLLGTWVIVLIVVAAVTVICLIAVGSYQLGVSKGLAKNPNYIEDVEPARVVTIPRVRGVTDSPINELM